MRFNPRHPHEKWAHYFAMCCTTILCGIFIMCVIYVISCALGRFGLDGDLCAWTMNIGVIVESIIHWSDEIIYAFYGMFPEFFLRNYFDNTITKRYIREAMHLNEEYLLQIIFEFVDGSPKFCHIEVARAIVSSNIPKKSYKLVLLPQKYRLNYMLFPDVYVTQYSSCSFQSVYCCYVHGKQIVLVSLTNPRITMLYDPSDCMVNLTIILESVDVIEVFDYSPYFLYLEWPSEVHRTQPAELQKFDNILRFSFPYYKKTDRWRIRVRNSTADPISKNSLPIVKNLLTLMPLE